MNKKFTTSMNRKVCWEDGYKKAKEEVENILNAEIEFNKSFNPNQEGYKTAQTILKVLESIKARCLVGFKKSDDNKKEMSYVG